MAQVLNIAIAIILLGILIVIHEGGHFLVARLSGMRVDRFSIGFGPALFKFQRGETVYQLSAIPLGGYVQIAGLNPGDESLSEDDPRSYPNRPVYQRLLTIFAGPGTNYLFAALLMAGIFVGWGEGVRTPMVGEPIKGRPADVAGLRAEDEIVSINGQEVRDATDVVSFIEKSQGAPVHIVVRRQHELREFDVKPAQEADGKWRIGMKLGEAVVRQELPFGAAIVHGFTWPYEQTVAMLHSLVDMFRGRQKAEFAGPVGIVSVMTRQFAYGPIKVLELMAAISVSLGLFNLLPFPALDGGRLAFLVVEGVSRRRVNQHLEQMVHVGGILVLFAFLIYVTFGHDLNLRSLLHR
ncbi:MAG TPA: M50 family metallopeptidase [Polyangia bacterium]|jgi:regulator of sigma E protease|nr:M50 family metallopeptidase [Polyangia bacterium]